MDAALKIKVYMAAVYLFDQGKSHPQIVDILKEYEPNGSALHVIVDKAMNNEWEKLHEETKELFSKGLPYDEIVKAISKKEKDPEIVDWICNDWYKVKTLQMECLVEGAENRMEGSQWVIISAIAIPVFFYMGSAWFVKAIWILVFTGALGTWILGMRQRRLANKVNLLFSSDLESGKSESS